MEQSSKRARRMLSTTVTQPRETAESARSRSCSSARESTSPVASITAIFPRYRSHAGGGVVVTGEANSIDTTTSSGALLRMPRPCCDGQGRTSRGVAW